MIRETYATYPPLLNIDISVQKHMLLFGVIVKSHFISH